MNPLDLHLNTDRLLRELHHLANLTDCPPTDDPTLPAPTTAVTRIVFTPRDLEARAYLTGLAQTAGFQVRVDPVGNTFLRWPGSDPTLPAVGTGSHTDAIPHAGMYDGTVGVLGGLEAMRSLKESGFIPRRSIETLMFTSEEPTRFGIGCLGSRLLGGVLDPTRADALPDLIAETNLGAPSSPTVPSSAKVGSQEAPATLHEVRTAAGFTGPLTSVKLPANYFHAWLELHIEQGPLLERTMLATQIFRVSEGSSEHEVPQRLNEKQAPQGFSENQVPQGFSLGSHNPQKEKGALASAPTTMLGIVTNIAAPASFRYTLTGFGGHAGALLMPDRRDALCAAAELILSVERHTLAANSQAQGKDSVATIGTVAVHPGAVNSVPSRVTLMLDIRDTDPHRRDRTLTAVRADITEIQSRRQVTIAEEQINADAPALCDPHILQTLQQICQTEAIPYKEMVSRAYHDTSFIAAIAPVAMLFIPCRNGVSHRPDEYATPESIALGTRVLALTLAALASE